MNFYATHYQSGEEIRPGDRILWAGNEGVVVFVLGLPGVPEDFASPEGWLGTSEGFMLDVDGAGWVFQKESDEDLDFVARKQ
ncbi:MAG: hypothetical protein HY040_01435 [Planctomycetes bacterium]|nr:hypothetical protein [Planctomycetota bacterium]